MAARKENFHAARDNKIVAIAAAPFSLLRRLDPKLNDDSPASSASGATLDGAAVDMDASSRVSARSLIFTRDIAWHGCSGLPQMRHLWDSVLARGCEGRGVCIKVRHNVLALLADLEEAGREPTSTNNPVAIHVGAVASDVAAWGVSATALDNGAGSTSAPAHRATAIRRQLLDVISRYGESRGCHALVHLELYPDQMGGKDAHGAWKADIYPQGTLYVDIQGGSRGVGESSLQAAVREADEEVGACMLQFVAPHGPLSADLSSSALNAAGATGTDVLPASAIAIDLASEARRTYSSLEPAPLLIYDRTHLGSNYLDAMHIFAANAIT